MAMRRRSVNLPTTLPPIAGGSGPTLVAHGSGTTSVAAINTTGANLLVAAVSYSGSQTLSDNKSNTWTPLTARTTSGAFHQLFYCSNPTVGSGHTFSTSGGGTPSMCVLAFSGGLLSGTSEFDGGTTSAGTGTLQPGSQTPAHSNDIIVTSGLLLQAHTPTIDSGFTVAENVNYVAGVNYGSAIAYLFQGAAAAVNPTWTCTSGDFIFIANTTAFRSAGAPLLSGAVSATSTAAGALSAASFISGATAAISSASGTVGTTARLTGSVAGTSSGAGALTASTSLAGSAAGTSTAAGALRAPTLLSGACAATSSAAGALAASTFLSGTAAGTSTATGALTAGTYLSGSLSSTSSATAAIKAAAVITGAVGAALSMTGSLTIRGLLSGSVVSLCAVTGAMTTTTPLTGSLSAVSTATGALRAPVFFAGASVWISGATGTVFGPRTRMILVRERAPLRLTTHVRSPSGYQARWGADDPRPQYAPSNEQFSTVMPGGDEQGSCVLQRDPSLNYPDLEQLSEVTVSGVGGEIASRGRLEQLPDTAGDQAQVTPTWTGHQADLADDNSAREIFVDRMITTWQGPSVSRQIQWLEMPTPVISSGPSVSPDFTTELPALTEQLSGTWTQPQVVEAWYDAHGIVLGRLYVSWDTQMVNFDGVLSGAGLFLCDDDRALTGFYDSLSADANSGTLAAMPSTLTRKWALLQFWSQQVPGGKDGATFGIYFPVVAVYGANGVPLSGTDDSSGAFGVLLSDAVAYMLSKWCPNVKFTTGPAGTIQPSLYVIPQLAFLDPTTVSAMLTAGNVYEQLDWGVWPDVNGDPTFYMNARGARGKKWFARSGPSQLQEAGPSITRLWNGVVVQYSDVGGINRTVGPPGSGANYEDASLLDPDPLNPCNQAGIRKWTLATMGESTSAGALRVGQIFLQEQKLLDTSGQATHTGWVQDEHGVWLPAWNMRGGDVISYTDSADPSFRRIVHTAYDGSSFANTVQLNQPPDSLAALLARLQISLAPYGM